jgi:hypothetical protein
MSPETCQELVLVKEWNTCLSLDLFLPESSLGRRQAAFASNAPALEDPFNRLELFLGNLPRQLRLVGITETLAVHTPRLRQGKQVLRLRT